MKTIAKWTLYLCLATVSWTAMAAEEYPAEVLEVRRVKSEISLLNLLNGLYLSESQTDKLIALADRAVQLKETYTRDLGEQADSYRQDLGKLRDALYAATGPDKELKQQTLRREVTVEIGPRRRLAEELGRVEDEARAVLNDSQIAIIEAFKPCLLPPQHLADPVAVGQASTTEREEKALDLIRRMPIALYRQRRQAIANAIVQHGEREKGQLPADVRAGMVATYQKKMADLRRLSIVDFDLQKSELAESFQLFDDDVTYRKGHTRELGPVSRHLLHERAAATLKKWRQARGSDQPQTILASVTATDEAVDVQSRAHQRALRRYGYLVQPLVNERRRMGKLTGAEWLEVQREMGRIRDLKSEDEQFEAVTTLVDRLNDLAITERSVDAATVRAVCLAIQKRVAGVFQPRRRKRKAMDDITGLGAMVKEGQEAAAQGRTEEAYATLSKVTSYLDEFAN